MTWKPLADHEPEILMYEGIRADSVAREPETVAWARQLGDGTLWDIGANVGAYTLVAAVNNPGITVVAFEPVFTNFFALMHNIVKNGLQDRVTALNLPLSDSTRVGTLNIHSLRVGAAFHAFDMDSPYTDEEPELRQLAVSMAVDELVDGLGMEPPDFIKLDVDSIEIEILRGAASTLSGVSSILVEADRGEQADEIKSILASRGLRVAEEHTHRLTDNLIFSREDA